MPVKIRLARTGRNKIACYRIVAADSRSPRGGRYLETLGDYNPQKNPKVFTIKSDRLAYWIEKGAIPTATVRNLLKQDRFDQKHEAMKKGLTPEQIQVERKPERKRKPKKKKEAKKS